MSKAKRRLGPKGSQGQKVKNQKGQGLKTMAKRPNYRSKQCHACAAGDPLLYPYGLHGQACCYTHVPEKAWHEYPSDIYGWLAPLVPTIQTVSQCAISGTPAHAPGEARVYWFLAMVPLRVCGTFVRFFFLTHP